jgi:predicted DNA-binding protein YlxM (UPF0122 family)
MMRIQSLSQEDIAKNEETYKQIFQLYDSGTMTLKEIGQIYNVSKQRIWQIVKEVKMFCNGEFEIQCDEEQVQIIFDTLNEWLEEMRGNSDVDMLDVYKAMVFVGSVNLIHLLNCTIEEADQMMDEIRANAFELLEIFGDRESVQQEVH